MTLTSALSFPNGNTNIVVRSGISTLVADISYETGIDVGLDEARKIEYNCFPVGWISINLTVKGWWF